MAFHSLLEPHADAVVDTHRRITAVLNMALTLSSLSSSKSISALHFLLLLFLFHSLQIAVTADVWNAGLPLLPLPLLLAVGWRRETGSELVDVVVDVK